MPTPRIPRPETAELTPRQEQAASLLGRGLTNARIAEELGISLDGAKYLVSEVITRLGVDTREEAADAWRARQGLAPRLRRFAARAFVPVIWRWIAAMVAVLVAMALIFALRGVDDEQAPAAGSPTMGLTEGTPSATAVPLARSVGQLAVLRGFQGRVELLEIDGTTASSLTEGLPLVHWVEWNHQGSAFAAWASESTSGPVGLWIVPADDPAGRRLLSLPGDIGEVSWSPDDSQLVMNVQVTGQGWHIYRYNLASGQARRLTEEPEPVSNLEWSPRGDQIGFGVCRECGAFWDVWVMDVDGANQRNLSPEPADRGPYAWSPDGSRIAYLAHPAGETQLQIVDLQGDVQRLPVSTALVGGPIARSPDSKSIAFLQAVDGYWQLALMEVDSGGIRTVTNPAFGSVDVGTSIAFSPDGHRVGFVRHRGLRVVDFATGSEHRLAGEVPAVSAWLAREPGQGIAEDSLAPVVTPVPFDGGLPAPGAVDANGWPVADCAEGGTPYRMETRRIALCVAEGWTVSHDDEFTQDGYWGASLTLSRDAMTSFGLSVLERERSGPVSNFFHGCDIQAEGMLLGVGAAVCAATSDRPNGMLEFFVYEDPVPRPPDWFGPVWATDVVARTEDYLLVVRASGNDDSPESEARVAEVLEMAASTRAGATLERIAAE